MTQPFVTEERQEQPLENLKVILRFIRTLPLLQWVFLPYLIIMIVSAILPQFFLWIIGEFSKCQTGALCSVIIPRYGEIKIGLLFVSLVVLLAFLTRVFSWGLFEVSGQWAVQAVHSAMVKAVSRVRTTYFDENPSGRLINRLVKDYDHLRATAIIRLGDFLNSIAEVVAAAAVLFFAHPTGALLIIPVLVVVLYIQRQIAQMLHHGLSLRSVRFGVVLHRETDLIDGARTFLLYGKLGSLAGRLQAALHDYLQIHVLRTRVEIWGRFWTSLVTSLYGVIGLVLIAFAISNGVITEVMAAVMITVLLRITPLFGWLSWVTAYLLESVATIRRTFELADLPHECLEEREQARNVTVTESPGARLRGDIVFEGYSMSYRKGSPFILENLNLTLPEGKKIGIVGRTGAGKTSVMQSLFRMVYVQSGDIKIGAQSIFDFDVDFTRSHIGVVPQDPYLFSGTIASNIDREDKFSKDVIARALKVVGLELDLGTKTIEGGENLSVGERQLVCLARLIINDVPYIVMDEPTSAVDSITDAKIQAVLNSELKDKTVITIAHRTDTLMRYDWIVELRDGKLERVGAPRDLLS